VRARHPDGRPKKAKEWAIHLSRTKTSLGFNKYLIGWKFVHKGETHLVELYHSTFGGKRTVKVDGIVKISEKKFIDNGAKYRFECGSTKATTVRCAVEIEVAGVSGWSYECLIDGRDFAQAKKHWLQLDEAK